MQQDDQTTKTQVAPAQPHPADSRPLSASQNNDNNNNNNDGAMTPPMPRILSDPKFLFYVAASHGPTLRADEVFVTKELFFRFFIESGIASAVSSYANKKKGGESSSSKNNNKDNNSSDKKTSRGGPNSESGFSRAESARRAMTAGGVSPASRMLSMMKQTTTSTFGGTANNNNTENQFGGDTTTNNNNKTTNNDDDVDEIEEEISSRIPSCWATPPISFAMLNRLWNENCAKQFIDVMFFAGFKVALDAMVLRAQNIYEQHFHREQALRKSLLEQNVQESMSFRIAKPVLSSMSRMSRRASKSSLLSTSSSKNNNQITAGKPPLVMAGLTTVDSKTLSRQGSMMRSPRVVKIAEHNNTTVEESNNNNNTDDTQQQKKSPSPSGSNNSKQNSPALSPSASSAAMLQQNQEQSLQEQLQQQQQGTATGGVPTTTGSESGASILSARLEEIDSVKPNPEGGSDYLSSKLDVFTSMCCHDFTSATLTLQSLHNGTAGVAQTTTEVLLASFARHAPLLRFLFRIAIHIHHLREVREMAARMESQGNNNDPSNNIFVRPSSSPSAMGTAAAAVNNSGSGGGGAMSSITTFRRNSLINNNQSMPNVNSSTGMIGATSATTGSSSFTFGSLPTLAQGVGTSTSTMQNQNQYQNQALPPSNNMGMGRRSSTATNSSAATAGHRTQNKSNKDMVHESIELLSASIFDVVAKSDEVRIEFLDRYSRDGNSITSETIVWLLSQAGASHTDHTMFLPEKGYTELLRLLRIFPSPVLGTEMLDTLFMTANHEDTKELAKTNVLMGGNTSNNASRPLSPGTGFNPLNHQSQQGRDVFSSSNTPTMRETPNDPFLNPSSRTNFEFDEFIDFVFAIAVAIHGDRFTYPKHVTVQGAVLNTLTLMEKCTASFIIDPLEKFTTHFAELVENTVAESMSPERQHTVSNSMPNVNSDTTAMMNNTSGDMMMMNATSNDDVQKTFLTNVTSQNNVLGNGLGDTASFIGGSAHSSPNRLTTMLHNNNNNNTQQQREASPGATLTARNKTMGMTMTARSRQPAIILRRNHFSVLHARSSSEFEATPNARRTADSIMSDFLKPDSDILAAREASPPDSMTNTYDSAGLARYMKIANVQKKDELRDRRLSLPDSSINPTSIANRVVNFNTPPSQNSSSAKNNPHHRSHKLVSDQINEHNVIQNNYDRNNHDLDVSGFNRKKIMMNINLEPTLRELSKTEIKRIQDEERNKYNSNLNGTSRFAGTMGMMNPNNFGAITLKLLGGPKVDQDGNAILSSTMTINMLNSNSNNNNNNNNNTLRGRNLNGTLSMTSMMMSQNPTALAQNALVAAQRGRPHALFERSDDVIVSTKYSVPPKNSHILKTNHHNSNGDDQDGKRTKEILAASMFGSGAVVPTLRAAHQNHHDDDDYNNEDEENNNGDGNNYNDEYQYDDEDDISRVGNDNDDDVTHHTAVEASVSFSPDQQQEEAIAKMLVPEIWAVVPRVVKLTEKEPKFKTVVVDQQTISGAPSTQLFSTRNPFLSGSLNDTNMNANTTTTSNAANTNTASGTQQQQENLENESTNIFISCWNMDAEPPSYSITSAMDELNVKKQREEEMEANRIANEQRKEQERLAEEEREKQKILEEEAAKLEKERQETGGSNKTGRTRTVGFAQDANKSEDNNNATPSLASLVRANSSAMNPNTQTRRSAALVVPHRSVYGNNYEYDEEGKAKTDFAIPTLQAVLHFRMLVRNFKTTKKDFSDSEEKDRWYQILRNIGSIETQNLFGKFDPRYVLDQAIANGIEGLKSFIRSQCNPLMFYSEDELVEMNFKSAVEKSRTSILLFGLKPGTIERDPFIKPLAVSSLATRRNRLYCASLSAKSIRKHFNGSAFVNVVCHPRSSKQMFAAKKTGRDFVASNLSTGGLEDLPPLAVEFLQSLYLHCSWVYRLDVAGGKSVSSEENSWLGTPQHCIAVECPPPKDHLKNSKGSGTTTALSSTMVMPFSVALKRAVYRFFRRHGTKKRMALPLRPVLPDDLSTLKPDADEDDKKKKDKKKKKKSRRKSTANNTTNGASPSSSVRSASPGSASMYSTSSFASSSMMGASSSAKKRRGKKKKKKGPVLEPTVIKPESKSKKDETDFHWFISRANFMKWASKVFSQQGGCHVQIPLSELSLVQHRHIDKFAGSLAEGSAFGGHTTVSLLDLFDFFATSSGISERQVAKWDFRFGKEIENIAPADIIWPKTEAELAAEKEAELLAQSLAKSKRGRFGSSFRPSSSTKSNSNTNNNNNNAKSSRASSAGSLQSSSSSKRKGSATKRKRRRRSPSQKDQDQDHPRPRHLAVPEKDTKNQITENDLSIVSQAFAWDRAFFSLEDGALLELPGPPALRYEPNCVYAAAPGPSFIGEQTQRTMTNRYDGDNSQTRVGKSSVVTVSFGGTNNNNNNNNTQLDATERPFSDDNPEDSSKPPSKRPTLVYPKLPENYRFADEEEIALSEISDEKGLSCQAFISLMSIVVTQLPSAVQTNLEQEHEEALITSEEGNDMNNDGEEKEQSVAGATTSYLSVKTTKATKSSLKKPQGKKSSTTRAISSRRKSDTSDKSAMMNDDPSNSNNNNINKRKKLPTVQVVCQRLQGLLDLDSDPMRELRKRWMKQAAEVDQQLPGDVEPLLPKQRFVPKPPTKKSVTVLNNNVNDDASVRPDVNDIDGQSAYERALFDAQREASLVMNHMEVAESMTNSPNFSLAGAGSVASFSHQQAFPSATFLPAPPSKASIYKSVSAQKHQQQPQVIIKEEQTQGTLSFAGYRSQYKRSYPSSEEQLLYASTLVPANATGSSYSGHQQHDNNSNNNKNRLYPNGTVFPHLVDGRGNVIVDDTHTDAERLAEENEQRHIKFLTQQEDNLPEDLSAQIENRQRLKKDSGIIDARDPILADTRTISGPNNKSKWRGNIDDDDDEVKPDPAFDELYLAQREECAPVITSQAILRQRQKRHSFEAKQMELERGLGGLLPSQFTRPCASTAARKQRQDELARLTEEQKRRLEIEAEEERRRRLEDDDDSDDDRRYNNKQNSSSTAKIQARSSRGANSNNNKSKQNTNDHETGTEVLSEYTISMRKRIVNDEDATKIVCEEPKWRDEGRNQKIEPVTRYDRGAYKPYATLKSESGDTGALNKEVADLSEDHKQNHFHQVAEERITSHLQNAVRVTNKTEEGSGAVMPDGAKMRDIKKQRFLKQQQQTSRNNTLRREVSFGGGGATMTARSSVTMNVSSRNNSNNANASNTSRTSSFRKTR